MKKLAGCQYEQKIRQGTIENKNLEIHLAGCPECRESQKVYHWMQKFKTQTTKTPPNLPAAGFLLFKSRLIKKQAAANRAVQPIIWAQIVALALAAATVIYLQVATRMSLGEIFTETFNLLSSITLLFILSLAGGALICLSFAYFIRANERIKKIKINEELQ